MKALTNLLLTIFVLFISLIGLVGCGSSSSTEGNFLVNIGLGTDDDEPSGTIIVWHAALDTEAELLTNLFTAYSQLYPKVTVLQQRYIMENNDDGEVFLRMLQQYRDAVEKGFGPDIVIMPHALIPDLVEDTEPPLHQPYIQNITPYRINTSNYLPQLLNQVRYKGQLYGVPLALYTQILLYNRDAIDTPPPTLNELRTLVEDGHNVGMVSQLDHLMWGVDLFGGQILDDEGRVVLDEGDGFEQWFNWLNESGFIFSTNQQDLMQAFANREIDFLLLFSGDIPALRNLLPEDEQDRLGAVNLPAHSGRPARALTFTPVMMFNPASSANSTAVSVGLAEFLTMRRQQLQLAREVETFVSMNKEAQLNAQLLPIAATLNKQAQSVITYPLGYGSRSGAIWFYASENRIVERILADELDPADAARDISQAINQLFGYE